MVDVGNRVARNRAIEIMSAIFEWVPSPIALLVDGTVGDNEAENARSGNIYYPFSCAEKRAFLYI